MLANVQLKHKIFFGFLFVAMFTLIVGGTNYFFLGKVIGKFDHVVTINMNNLDHLSEMRDAARVLRSRMYFLLGASKGREDKVKLSLERMAQEMERFENEEKKYSEVEFVPGEDELFKTVEAEWKKVKVETRELLALYKVEGSSEKFQEIFFTKYEVVTDDLFKSLSVLMEFQKKEGAHWAGMSADIAQLSSKVSLIMMFIGFLVSIGLGSILTKTITNQLTFAINDLNRSAPELIRSATDLGSMSSELSSCSTEQAAAVQETASSLEEISTMIKRNSDHTENALSSSSESLSSVKKGQSAVANMMEAMSDINTNNNAFNEFMKKNNDELKEMVNVITNISEKTKVINDIVFQTKLLSFNASVEAARAGEQGKGFAVVAEEVGNLAQMSGNAANEIKGLLEESIVKVNEIVTNTKTQVERLVHDGKLKIETGIHRAKDCDTALSDINLSVEKVQSLVNEVSLASNEQSQGIGEVNKAMGQIDEVTNQNSVAAQKVSDNASSVMQLSQSVKETSDKLTALLLGAQFKAQSIASNSSLNTGGKVFHDQSGDYKTRPTSAPVKKMVALSHAPKKEKVKVAFKAEDKSLEVALPKKKNEASIPAYDDKRFEDV